MDCARCNIPLQYMGEKKFHEGKVHGDLDFLLQNIETYEVYLCSQCRQVSFFIPESGISQARSEAIKLDQAKQQKATLNDLKREFGSIKKHPQYKEFISEDVARKYMQTEDLEKSFVSWLASR